MKATSVLLGAVLVSLIFFLNGALGLRGSGEKGQQQNPPPYFFGWYGYSPKDQAGWVSLGVSPDSSVLVQGKKDGVPMQFYDLEGWYLVYGQREGKPGLELRKDWKRTFQDNLPMYKLYENGTINGFFMGDELMWNGLEYSQLVEWSNEVRKHFPKAWIWENEATAVYKCPMSVSANTSRTCAGGGAPCCDYEGRIVSAPVIPPALNSQSIDLYRWAPGNPTAFSLAKSYYEEYLLPRLNLTANQSFFVVPGSAASTHNPNCNISCYENLVITQAWDFYNWMITPGSQIRGMVPWNWNNCTGCVKFRDEIGTVALPKVVAAWQEIGKRILKHNNQSML